MKQDKLSGNGGNGDHGGAFSGDLPESVVDHSWGNVHTWLIIVALSVFVVVTTLIMYAIIGKHTLQNWNLGTPPTAPSFISLF